MANIFWTIIKVGAVIYAAIIAVILLAIAFKTLTKKPLQSRQPTIIIKKTFFYFIALVAVLNLISTFLEH